MSGHRQAEPGCNTSARSTNEGEIIVLRLVLMLH